MGPRPIHRACAVLASALVLAACAASSEQDRAPLDLAPPTGPGARLPNLTRGANGAVLLSWVEPRGRESALRMARLGAHGWEEPREIACGSDWFVNWADFPALAALTDGTLIAHWLQANGTGTYDYGVRFRLSNDGGLGWSEPRWLHDDRSPGEHGFVSFAALDATRFGAIWLDSRHVAGDGQTAGAMALYFRTIASTGELGPELRLDERVCDCCQTALVATPDRGLLAAYRDRSGSEVRDVWTCSVRDGRASTPRSLADDGWRIDGCPVNGPRLAAGGREVAAAWYTGAGGGAGQVYVAFASAGGPFDAPIPVDEGAPEGRVDAVFLADGTLAVAWMEHEEGRAAWRLRRVRADGARGPSVVVAPIPSERSSGFLRLVADRDRVLAAWTEPDPHDGTSRIVVAPIDPPPLSR